MHAVFRHCYREHHQQQQQQQQQHQRPTADVETMSPSNIPARAAITLFQESDDRTITLSLMHPHGGLSGLFSDLSRISGGWK
jgi:hypothetical protein